MTKTEAQRRNHMNDALRALGFTSDECESLRRISMQLHSWHERECGTDNGCIERDETTDKPYWLNSNTMRRYPIRDMEKGAIHRLSVTMQKHDPLTAYIQTDPRGAALYILRPGDIPAGQSADSCYSRGICVY